MVRKGSSQPEPVTINRIIEDGIPIGQIRFNKQTSVNDGGRHEAMIDFSIDRCAGAS